MGKNIFTLGIISLSLILSPGLVYSKNPDVQHMRIGKGLTQLAIEEESLDDETMLRKLNIGNYSFDFDKAYIIKSKFYDNDKGLIVYIKNFEEDYKVQKSIHQTLEELLKENRLELLLLELETDEEVFSNSVTGEELRDSGGHHFEFIYDDKITTLGAESELKARELLEFSENIVLNLGKGHDCLSLFREEVVYKRSKVMAEKVIKEMKNRNKELAVLICGGSHARSLVKSFEDNGTSYIVVESEAYKAKFEEHISRLKEKFLRD